MGLLEFCNGLLLLLGNGNGSGRSRSVGRHHKVGVFRWVPVGCGGCGGDGLAGECSLCFEKADVSSRVCWGFPKAVAFPLGISGSSNKSKLRVVRCPGVA